jgi:hypothetical protein
LARYSVVVEGRTRIFLAGGLCIETPHGLLLERAFPGRQARHCFARLVGARGRPVSREELADELWPGDLPGAWETALRAIVSKLRTVLAGSGVAGASISLSPGSYQLRSPADVWVDIDAADAIHRAEAASPRAGPMSPAAGRLPLARSRLDCSCQASTARGSSSSVVTSKISGCGTELPGGSLIDRPTPRLPLAMPEAFGSTAREISHRLLIWAIWLR